jgi:hypothetical protein
VKAGTFRAPPTAWWSRRRNPQSGSQQGCPQFEDVFGPLSNFSESSRGIPLDDLSVNRRRIRTDHQEPRAARHRDIEMLGVHQARIEDYRDIRL